MKKLISVCLLFVAFCAAQIQVKASEVPWSSKDVMMQGFYWDSYQNKGFGDTKWASLQSQVGEISSYFDLIWLPPSARSGGGVGYMPKEWSNQNSTWGSAADLKNLISSLKAGGTKAIADIVVNHRDGNTAWANFATDNFGEFGTFQLTQQHICSGDECWTQGGVTGTRGGSDDGENYDSARDLDHNNKYVQDDIKAYLKWLKAEMGYEGWRYDMVKGFSGTHVADYNNASDAYISIGEYYDGSFDANYAWLQKANNSMVFDFPLKFVLNDAFKYGNFSKLCWTADGVNQPAGMIHAGITKQRAVTFLDNHDTYDRGNGQELGDVNSAKTRILQASAFQLCSPGIPCVFYPHWAKYKEELKPMIEARKGAEVHSNSKVTVISCSNNLYVAEIFGDNGSLIVKIGSGSYSAAAGYALATSGTDYAIWSKYTSTPDVNKVAVSFTPSAGTYEVGQKITLSANSTDAAVYYTTDGTTPSKSSTKYTAPFELVEGTSTVKAIAYLGDKTSAVAEATYDIINMATRGAITVYFKKPAGWSTVCLWAWDADGDNVYGGPNWPGKSITDMGNGWWKYTFDEDLKTVNVIFNDGKAANAEQTADIMGVAKDTWYEWGGAKSDPVVVPAQSTAVESVNGAELAIYPNPTTDKFIVMGAESAKVAVYAVNGAKVIETAVDANSSVDVSALAKGIYLVKVVTADGENFTTKLIKK